MTAAPVQLQRRAPVSALEQSLIREFGFRAGERVRVRIGHGDHATEHAALVDFVSVEHGFAQVGDAFFDARTGRLIHALHYPNPPYCAIRRPRPASALKGGVE